MEFGSGFLLDAEDDVVGTSDADGGVTFADGFEGVLDLEEVAVGGEHRDCSIVPRHFAVLCVCYLVLLLGWDL